MIVYNVTLKVEKEIAEKYQNWLKEEHIPEMLSLGIFSKNQFCRLLEHEEEEAVTFVCQYFCESLKDYQKYLDQFAPKMRQKGLDLFGNQFVGFRTLMEVID